MNKLFEGASTALITPMKAYDSRIIHVDSASLKQFAAFNARYADSLVLYGTTGQSPVLTRGDEESIYYECKYFSTPIIFGAGSNCTAKAVEATERAARHRDSATLHVTGYYNMPSQLGLLDHFLAVADASARPVIMYDVPSRGHPMIQPETRIEAAKQRSNIIGVKDATGDRAVWKKTQELARQAGLDMHRFKLLSGNDPDNLEMMKKYEGVGIISVTANIFPYACRELTEAAMSGDYAKAEQIDTFLAPFNGIIGIKACGDAYKNPAPVQHAAYLLGTIESDALRLPLVALSDERVPEAARETVRSALADMYRSCEQQPEMHELSFEPIEQFFNVNVEKLLKM